MSMKDSLAYAEKIVKSALSSRIRAEKTDRVGCVITIVLPLNWPNNLFDKNLR